jgi:cytoskeletal protein CcmA (bactofilin family)
MWKKEEAHGDKAQVAPEPIVERRPSVSQTASPQRATIGKAISIRGDVTGDEDLLIQGRVEGSVELKEHAVTIGSDGQVKASIIGRVVVVEGRVEGNISARDQVVLRGSSWVQGDITAPRVSLEDGARFRGGVDMGDMSVKGGLPRGETGAREIKASDTPLPGLLEETEGKAKPPVRESERRTAVKAGT